MTLLLVMVTLTLAVVGALSWPLLRKTAAAAPQRVDYDMAIYRDQLAEVDRDVERGLLGAEPAEAAKAEIYRRMLQAEDAEIQHSVSFSKPANLKSRRLALPLFLLIFVPVGAFLLYAYLGSPELPAKPYAERKNDPEFIMAMEAEKLDAKLEQSPDAEGYKHLADTYFLLRRYDQAADAYVKSIGLSGGNAAVWSELGESLALAHGGVVTPEAEAAFTKALNFDAHEARARFYLGLKETQANNPRRAVSIWKDLQKDSPPDAPWSVMLKEQIGMVSKKTGFDPDEVKPEPPSSTITPEMLQKLPKANASSPADVDPNAAAAVMAMSPDEQKAMIHKMVDRLAAKLRDNPDDLAGWQRLAKAYRVLGETDKAKEAESRIAKLQGK